MKIKTWLKFLGALPMFSVEGEGDGSGGGDNLDGSPPVVPPVVPPVIAPPPDPTPSGEASKWPDTWREDYSKDDEKRLNRLKRFTTPEAALDWAFEADKKLSMGKSLPENATPEQLAAWRESMGIPKDLDGYKPHLQDMAIGPEDEELIKGFLENSLGSNLTPNQVTETLKWFYGEREKLIQNYEQDTYNRDTADKMENTKNLRAEWGGAYERNLAAVNWFLAESPKEFQDLIEGGRLSNGARVGNNPSVLNWLSNMAMELNPAITVVPGAGVNSISQIDSEISAIEARMGGDTITRNAYYKDEAAQARYRDLITAREGMGAKR